MTRWNSEKANKEINKLFVHSIFGKGDHGKTVYVKKKLKRRVYKFNNLQNSGLFSNNLLEVQKNICWSSKLLHTWKRKFCMAWWWWEMANAFFFFFWNWFTKTLHEIKSTNLIIFKFHSVKYILIIVKQISGIFFILKL